jgi:hypothetical protein
MELKLEPGEVICDKCDGETFIRYTEERGNGFYPMKMTCPKCNGHGKLDWIENITGTQKDEKSDGKMHWPDLKQYAWTWFDSESDEPTKKSYQDIKWDINPKFKKQLERRMIKDLNRSRR